MPVKLPEKNQPALQDIAPTAGATKPSLIDSMPLRLVLWLASPYIAGQEASNAIACAHRLYRQHRFTSTLDILGEHAENEEECDQAVKIYQDLVVAVATQPLPCSKPVEQMTISFKPSMFCSVSPSSSEPHKAKKLENAYHRIKSLVDFAYKHNVKLTLEAEDHRWADFHLDTYFSLVNAGYTNLGTVLQSRLFRTASDVQRFDDRMRVRLVIGIYNEPPNIAHTKKQVMKELLIDYADELLKRGVYVELATHDTNCVKQFFQRVAIPKRTPVSQFETQFLLGVPRKELQYGLASGKLFKDMSETISSNNYSYLAELASQGVLVRLYVPFGKDEVAGPYCKRRLKANPNMISYGIKNLLHLK